MKKVKLFFAVGVASAALSMTSFAGEWKQDASGWWYQNDDGSYPVNSWKEIDGKQYYFGNDGYMLHDTATPDGKNVGNDGALVSAPLFDYDIQNCHITYTKHEFAKDYNGNDCLIIYYNYTNKRSDECSAMGNSAYISLYQNGVQKDHATLPFDSKNEAVSNHYKNVMPGVTIEVAEAFKIDDRSEVTLVINDIFDFTRKSPKIHVSLSL